MATTNLYRKKVQLKVKIKEKNIFVFSDHNETLDTANIE